MDDIAIKEINDFEELYALVELERRIWALPDIDNLSPATVKAATGAGGLALAAFDGKQAVAFAFGFPAYKNDALGVGFHSHILGVLPEYQGRGLGRRLKLRQRKWCLARSLNWMTWTFDPLQSGNARFNIEYLGAGANIYKINEYGVMGGELNAELPSDRLLAFWDLQDSRVALLAAGNKVEEIEIGNITAVLIELESGAPLVINDDLGSKAIRLEIPKNINALVKQNPEIALKWRLALREQMIKYFRKHYRVKRFIDNGYILEKDLF